MKTIAFLIAIALLLVVALLLAVPSSHAVDSIILSLDDIQSPVFSAKRLTASVQGLTDVAGGRLELRIAELRMQARSWRDVRVSCTRFTLDRVVRCVGGTLIVGGTRTPVNFNYDTALKQLDLIAQPADGESWRLSGRFGEPAWRVELEVLQGAAARLAAWLPETIPKPAKGALNGRVILIGGSDGIVVLDTDIRLNDLSFSDAAGLQAGEKVAGGLRLTARKSGEVWSWQGVLDWRAGEVFWQPLYFAGGGHRLQAQGSFDGNTLAIEQGALELNGIGRADLALRWDLKEQRLTAATVSTSAVDLDGLYRGLLKPFLEKTALDSLEAHGRASFAWRYRDGATQEFGLGLEGASFKDTRGRFALADINAAIPWRLDQATTATLRFAGGQLLGVKLGAVDTAVALRGYGFNLPQFVLPILDGSLTLNDFQAAREADSWRWQFSGGLSPVSMRDLTKSLNLPEMLGTLSGVIPSVRYAQQTLTVDGALLFRVFDGTIVANRVVVEDPLGRAPRLNADVDMRNLDLKLVTDTFSFGKMEGRVDVTVAGLELSNWRPVKLDGFLRSSPGGYPKRISQQAVENISALGGAGAAAALQRSFLRFFKEFGYDQIALSCRLRNNLCQMDGVEPTAQGYVIVKGGGIPAITVIGYNRSVGWEELMSRLARITQTNAPPIVK